MFITGCSRAGYLQEDRLVVPERFAIRAPSEALWALKVNRRGPRWTEVTYRHRKGGAFLRLRVRTTTRELEQLPLDVLAHQLFLREMQLDGGIPELESMTRIALEDRQAIAFTGRRFDRPQVWRTSLLVLRSQGHLVILSFGALEAIADSLEGEFERLLRHFEVLLPGRFDPWLLDDIPMGAPGPSPGNRGRRPQDPAEKPLIGPDQRSPLQ